jgi:hypothetical protein
MEAVGFGPPPADAKPYAALLCEAAAVSCRHRSLQQLALLGARVDRSWPRPEVDAGAICEALREARKERCCRCGSDLRGSDPPDHALCGCEGSAAAEHEDAASSAADAEPSAHAVVERDSAHLSEFGIVASVGRNGVDQLLKIVADSEDDRVPEDARLCLQMLAAQLTVVKQQVLENDRRVLASAPPD